MVERMRELSGVFFIRTLMSFMRVFPVFITSQSPHLLMPSHWGLGFQNMNFGGHTHLVQNTTYLCSLVPLTPSYSTTRAVSSQKPSLTTPAHCILFFLALVNYMDSMFKIHKEPCNPSSGNGPPGKAALVITAACFPCQALRL